MQTQIVFGDRSLPVELPDETMRVPPGVSIPLAPQDIEDQARSALDEPFDLPPLRELARGRKKVLIAFDDPTVPCYAPVWPVVIPMIVAELESAGVERQDISLMCANALHRKFSPDELGALIGPDIVKEFADRLTCHDAEDPEGLVELGRTERGFEVDLNRSALEHDLVVYLNASTTRGFSGGWKSICVGLSSYRSIAHHHTPEIMSMSLDRNPMHEMLDEMGGLVTARLGDDHFFKLETVLSNPLQVARIFGGTVDACRAAALDINRANMSNRRDLLPEKADIVMYGVPDWSPYAAFSFTNPLLTLVSTALGYLGGMIEALGKPGCTVILATPCPDRWDHQHHPSYKEVWDRVLPQIDDPNEARSLYEQEFATRPDYIEKYRNEFGFHGVHGIMALYPLKRLRHAGRVLVAGADDPGLVEHAGFTPFPTFEEAVSEARATHGKDSSLALVEYPLAVNRQ